MPNEADGASVDYQSAGVVVDPGSRRWSLGGGAQDEEAVYVNVTVHAPDDAFMVRRCVLRIPLSVNGGLKVGAVEVLTPEEVYGGEA